MQEESPWKGRNALSGGSKHSKSMKKHYCRHKLSNEKSLLDLVDQRPRSKQQIAYLPGKGDGLKAGT